MFLYIKCLNVNPNRIKHILELPFRWKGNKKNKENFIRLTKLVKRKTKEREHIINRKHKVKWQE